MAKNLRELLASAWQKFRMQLPYLPRTLRLAWSAARAWTLLWGMLLLAQGLLPIATVYLTRALINGLVAAYRSGGSGESLRPLVVTAVLMGAVMLAGELFRSATNVVRTAQSELVQDHITALIHQKSVAVDLAFYDSPEFYDHLHRATREASYRPLALLETLGSLLQNGVTLAAMGAVLIPFGWWLPVSLLVSTLPALAVVMNYSFREHQWRLQTTPDERRTRYYDWLMTSSDGAAELRLLDLGGHFQSCYRTLRRRLYEERLRLVRQEGAGELAASVVALAISGVTLAGMAWKTLLGGLTPGDLAMFYQAFQQGLSLTRTLLGNVGALYANLLFLGNLFEFLELRPEVVEPAQPRPAPATGPRSIRFRDVTFCYPGSRRQALRNFSLHLRPGQVTAVVGSNGAGKSTLIRLLCRFYDPEAGGVELDGIDLRELSLEWIRREITVLFQEPVHYQTSVTENIALGDLAARPERPAIEAAARAAGADQVIAHLPGGYDNQLGRWFTQSTELSVGEWQRLALARAFFRRASILVLDEPTSAMDPWAEADWLQRFRKLAAGRTSLIVTHRLTTAVFADIIHVMVDGRIVESGSHPELLARGGQYAQAWRAQPPPSMGETRLPIDAP